jgi:hypothetical protein
VGVAADGPVIVMVLRRTVGCCSGSPGDDVDVVPGGLVIMWALQRAVW